MSVGSVPRACAGPLVAALLLALAPGQAAAQVPATASDSAVLAGVLEHLDAARFDSARASLEAWRAARLPDARESDRVTAAGLAARLESDGIAAQHAWLALALGHPFGDHASLALLRVGQAAVLQGDTAGALVYLTRLIDDFAASGFRSEAHLWLSRAHFLAGRPRAACDAARAGLAIGASSEVRGLLSLQEARACAPAAAAGPPVAGPSADARFAVQTGAFRGRSGADGLAAHLRARGFEPRLVRVPESQLMRVRVGAFPARAEAARLRDRLRSAGFEAVVVDDAGSESAVP